MDFSTLLASTTALGNEFVVASFNSGMNLIRIALPYVLALAALGVLIGLAYWIFGKLRGTR